MKQYDIFKSEGGYRVAGDICLGNPVISASPWRKTERSAIRLAEKMKSEGAKHPFYTWRLLVLEGDK